MRPTNRVREGRWRPSVAALTLLAVVVVTVLAARVVAVQLDRDQAASAPGTSPRKSSGARPTSQSPRPSPSASDTSPVTRPHSRASRAPRAPRARVRLSFGGSSTPLGTPVTRVENRGTATVDARIVTSSGGRAVYSRGSAGGRAVRFPAFEPGAAAPRRAALRVSNATGSDQLSPGSRPFSFGATVRLFRRHQGSRLVDNGSNLMQHGEYDDRGQYKIELDRRVPTCRVKGTAGAVAVSAPTSLNARDWYRIECRRSGPVVAIRVVQLVRRPGAPTRKRVTVDAAGGPIGSVRTYSSATPLSVGGKFLPSGGLDLTSTDQFNGEVDEAVLRID